MRTIELPGLAITLRCTKDADLVRIDLIAKGRGYCVWPNREGEGFELDRVYPVLEKHRCLEKGMTLSWPATASSQCAALFSQGGPGILFQLEDDPEGLHREIRITAAARDEITLSFTGKHSPWSITDLPARDPVLPPAHKPEHLQFQAGLIDNQGRSGIPHGRGFDFLPELADMLTRRFGPFRAPPILHIFGYAHGHDRGYPDYTPAAKLGGSHEMKRAAQALHSRGFLLSCYLNGRIVDGDSLAQFPALRPGAGVIEHYWGRPFHVMDPNFKPWLEELEAQALKLKELGADIVQLDQLAGRAAVVPPGKPWGEGYRRLIASLQKQRLKVWIQGVSDYYNADWFEMTWRDVCILPGGIVRGGNPFGKTDLTLLHQFRPKGRYLVPQSKLKDMGGGEYSLILDVLGDRGRLPVLSREYFQSITDN